MATQLISAVLGDVPMVVATGALDGDSCASLRSALEKIIAARFSVVFLDVTAVDRVDSDGISAIRAGVQALGRWGWIGLIGAGPELLRLLEIEGLLAHPMIRFFPDRQAARIACGERAST
jgi:anti-anti-sigma regulatory factor